MVSKYTIISCFICFWALGAVSQYTNVVIETQGNSHYPPCEPSIAIDPTDPSRMVAGAILDRVYYSEDSGRTWQSDQLKSEYGVFGDPCVIAGPKGDFYYFHLSDPSGKGWSHSSILDRIVAQRSCDGGKTWSKGAGIGLNGDRDQDKEWAVADPGSGRIHVTWTEFQKYGSKDEADSTFILYSSSNRKARKWTKPVRINRIAGDCVDSDETVEGAVPAVGPDGEVYVAWALENTIWFDRSPDGGKSWLENDIPAAEITGGWNLSIPGIMRANGMPVTRCDVSDSPHRGSIYINWCDQRNGVDDTDVWLVKSTDGGLNWSPPLRVNQDGAGHHQFFTWMDVDPVNGDVYIVYYDRRIDLGVSTEVYVARSTDGGESFEEMKVSEYPFQPSDAVFFGDYNNIAVYNGVVRPIWTHYEDRKLSIRTAIMNFSPESGLSD